MEWYDQNSETIVLFGPHWIYVRYPNGEKKKNKWNKKNRFSVQSEPKVMKPNDFFR